MSKIRTRIAPSPTGFLHLGTARTALYSWAYARHFGGEFVVYPQYNRIAGALQVNNRVGHNVPSGRLDNVFCEATSVRLDTNPTERPHCRVTVPTHEGKR